MEERMTVCNMSIEAGARAGMIAPDETTYQLSPRPATSLRRFRRRGEAWQRSAQRPGRKYDRVEIYQAADISAASHLGHKPRAGGRRSATSAEPADITNDNERKSAAGGWSTWA